MLACTLGLRSSRADAPFMVKFFGLTDDDRELGFYAGFIMTAYMVGSGLTAILWGILSDRHGKKWVIMAGLLANTVPQVLFGMATSMPVALTWRGLMGLLNGVVGAAKAYAPELVPPTEQAAAMSMIAASWGMGNLLGPAIGGLLSQYDRCDSKPLTSCPAYPFLLPNLVCAVLSGFGLVAVQWLLPNDQRSAAPASKPSESTEAAIESSVLPPQPVETDRAPLRPAYPSGDGLHVGAAASNTLSGSGSGDAEVHQPRLLRARLICFYFFIAFNDIVYNEVLPLFCVAPAASGGLGFESKTLGWLLSASGLSLLTYQLLVFPPLSRRVSIGRLCTLATLASGVLYGLLPSILFAAGSGRGGIWTLLLVHSSLLRFALGTAFTCTFTLLNNSVPAEARGRMQGVAMTVGSGARALGPTLGSELFAWSLTNSLPLPFDVHFVFLFMGLLTAVPVAIALTTFTRALDLPMKTTGTSSSRAAADIPKVNASVDVLELEAVGHQKRSIPV